MNEELPTTPRVVIDSSILVPILRYPQPETNWLVSMWQEGLLIPLVPFQVNLGG